jgi:hypothetical protein
MRVILKGINGNLRARRFRSPGAARLGGVVPHRLL